MKYFFQYVKKYAVENKAYLSGPVLGVAFLQEKLYWDKKDMLEYTNDIVKVIKFLWFGSIRKNIIYLDKHK